jgi:3',5'-cyclic AMP phosphodiesterase CpdA
MRIAQVSDLHFYHFPKNIFTLLSKRIFGVLNWQIFRKKLFHHEQLDPLIELFKTLNVDLVLLGGDFTTTSLSQEFKHAKHWTDQLCQPFLAVPGNHDVYTYKSQKNKLFYQFFTNKKAQISSPIDFFNLNQHRVEAHKLHDNQWLVLLDTCIATKPTVSSGLFSEKQQSYLKELLQLIPQNDLIYMMCHYPFFLSEGEKRGLTRGEELEKIIQQDPRIQLFLHGHTHRQIIADLQACNYPLVLDCGSASLKDKGSFHLLDLDRNGCTLALYKWQKNWTCQTTQRIQWQRIK